MKRQNEMDRLKRREILKTQRTNSQNRFQSLEALTQDAEMRDHLHDTLSAGQGIEEQVNYLN